MELTLTIGLVAALGLGLCPWISVALATSVETPSIIYGTAWKKGRTSDLVKLAIQQGFRALDTSNMPKHYNESLVGFAVGEALRDPLLKLRREDFWIQTKFTPDACNGQPLELQPYDASSPVGDRVLTSFAGSLQHLGVEYINSFLLHAPFARREDTLAAWRQMEILHQRGLARQIGVSNFNHLELKWLLAKAKVTPAFVQNRCLHKHDWDKEVRELCRKRGIQYQGFWLLTGNRFVLGSGVIAEIAQHHGKTRQQVLFAFVMQQFGVIPLTGTQNSIHMVEDLTVNAKNLPLTHDELALLSDLSPEGYTDGDPVQVTFQNSLDAKVSVFWEQPDSGKLFSQGTLQAHGSLKRSSFHSHTFVMRMHGDVIQRWRANRAHGEYQTVQVHRDVQVQFVNVGKDALQVFWKAASGSEVAQGAIEAGQSIEIKTFVNDRFVMKDVRGAVVQQWMATAHASGKHRVEVRSEVENAQGQIEL